jgi:hypothetical protein
VRLGRCDASLTVNNLSMRGVGWLFLVFVVANLAGAQDAGSACTEGKCGARQTNPDTQMMASGASGTPLCAAPCAVH